MGQVPDKRRSRKDGTGEVVGTSVRSHSIYIDGKPHPKERPRVVTTKSGRAVAYTPQKTVAAEKKIKEAWDGPKFSGEVCVHIVVDTEGTAVIVERLDLDTKSKLRGDLDNYVKTILDALNGVAWDDDSQVVKIIGIKA
jgi:Holliday junction resolvase RusA-like endonuclease